MFTLNKGFTSEFIVGYPEQHTSDEGGKINVVITTKIRIIVPI